MSGSIVLMEHRIVMYGSLEHRLHADIGEMLRDAQNKSIRMEELLRVKRLHSTQK